MDEKIEKIKKRVKGDRRFIEFILFAMVGLAATAIMDIVKYAGKSPDQFEVRMADDESFKGYYCLYIDGESWDTVDYNEFMTTVDENGNTNIKMCVIIQETGKLIRTIIMGFIFYFAFLILDNIFEPFSKRNIRRLRVIAVLTMLLAIVPAAAMLIFKMVVFSHVNLGFSQINFFVLMTGILLGIISEIFKYGHELQEDMDQIA